MPYCIYEEASVNLLKDDELVDLIRNQNLISSDIPHVVDDYAPTSPIQPSSLDLHIGTIYLPDTDATTDKRGNAQNPIRDWYTLPAGDTAVIRTKERIIMPANIAAFGFPPSHVSANGLLMTNPGHIDPGYSGTLEFTVINMGRTPYPLKIGDGIVTLLLVRLSGNCHTDYTTRNPPDLNPIAAETNGTQSTLDRLSVDFLDVTKRAGDIAKTMLEEAKVAQDQLNNQAKTDQERIRNWTVGITGVIALLATVLPLIINGCANNRNDDFKRDVANQIADIKRDAATMQAMQNVSDVKASTLVDKIKTDVQQLRGQSIFANTTIAQLQKDLAELQTAQDPSTTRSALDKVQRDISAIKKKLK
jgi:dCTP deaminase